MARNIKLGKLGQYDWQGMFAEKNWTKDPDVGIRLETTGGSKSFFSTCSPRVVLYKNIGNTNLTANALAEEIGSVGGVGQWGPNGEGSAGSGLLDGENFGGMNYPDYMFPFGSAWDPAKEGTSYTVDLNNSVHAFLDQFILFTETVTIPEGKAWIPLFFEYNFVSSEVKGVKLSTGSNVYCHVAGARMGQAIQASGHGRMLDRPRQLYNSSGIIDFTLRSPQSMTPALKPASFGNIWNEHGTYAEYGSDPFDHKVVGVPDNSKFLSFPLTGRIEGGVTLLPPLAQLQSYAGNEGQEGLAIDENRTDSWALNDWNAYSPGFPTELGETNAHSLIQSISFIKGFPVGLMLLEISYDHSSGAGISLGRDGHHTHVFAGHIVDNFPEISSKKSGIAAFEAPGEKQWTVKYWESITASNTLNSLSNLGDPTFETVVDWATIGSDAEHSFAGYNPPATTADCNAPSGIGYCNYGTTFAIQDLFPGSGLTDETAHNYQAHFTTWINVASSLTVTTCFHSDNKGYLYINNALIAESDWSTPGAFTYTFTGGWYKIDMVYYESGGGDYAHLGFNINNIPQIVGGGGSIKSSTVFDSNIPRIVHAGFHWDPDSARNRANIITNTFWIPTGKRWVIYIQPSFDSIEIPDTMTLHGHDIIEPKLNTVWPAGDHTWCATGFPGAPGGQLTGREDCDDVNILQFGCPDTCVSGDTLILTKEGPLEAKQIKKGMLVQVYDFETKSILFKEVKDRTLRKTKIWIQYTLETGKTIKCTLDHTFYRPERPENKIGYTDLKIGDSLYTLEKEKVIEEKITNIEVIKTKKQEKAYTFTIKDIPLYISNGIFSHNIIPTPGFDQPSHSGLPYASGTTELFSICTVESGNTTKAFIGPRGITGEGGSWSKLCIEMLYNNCAGLYTNKISANIGEINIGFTWIIFEVPDGAHGLLENWSDGNVVEPEIDSSAVYMSNDPVSSIVTKDFVGEGITQQQHMNPHMPILRYFQLVNLFKKPDKGYAPESDGSGDAYPGSAGMRDYHRSTSTPYHYTWNLFGSGYAPAYPFSFGDDTDWVNWYGGPESTYRTIAGNPRGNWSPIANEEAFTIPAGRTWLCTIQPMRNLERHALNDHGYWPNESGAEMPVCSITGGNPTTGIGTLFNSWSAEGSTWLFGGSEYDQCPTYAGFFKQGILFRRRSIGGGSDDWSEAVTLQGGTLEGGFEYSWLKAKSSYQISSLDLDKQTSGYLPDCGSGGTTSWYLVTTDYSGHQFKFERPFEFMFMIFDVPDEWPISQTVPTIPDHVFDVVLTGCTEALADNYSPNATVSCTEANYPGGCVDDFNGNPQTGANCCCFQTEQVDGCTDPTAENYTPGANTNDGSCIWNCSSEGVNSTEMFWTSSSSEVELTATYLCMNDQDPDSTTVHHHSGDHACGTPMGGSEGSNKWHLVSIEENMHQNYTVWNYFNTDGGTDLINLSGYSSGHIYRAVCDATPCEDVGGGENCPDYCVDTSAYRGDTCSVTGELPDNWACTGGDLAACTCSCYGAGLCHSLSILSGQVCTGTTQSSETACVSNVCGAGSTANACGSDTRIKIHGVSCNQCTSACTTNCGTVDDCPFGCYGNNVCHANCCETAGCTGTIHYFGNGTSNSYYPECGDTYYDPYTGNGTWDAGENAYTGTCPETCVLRGSNSANWPAECQGSGGGFWPGYGCIMTNQLCYNDTSSSAAGTCVCATNTGDVDVSNAGACCGSSSNSYFCPYGCDGTDWRMCLSNPCAGQCSGSCVGNHTVTTYTCSWHATGSYSCEVDTQTYCDTYCYWVSSGASSHYTFYTQGHCGPGDHTGMHDNDMVQNGCHYSSAYQCGAYVPCSTAENSQFGPGCQSGGGMGKGG